MTGTLRPERIRDWSPSIAAIGRRTTTAHRQGWRPTVTSAIPLSTRGWHRRPRPAWTGRHCTRATCEPSHRSSPTPPWSDMPACWPRSRPGWVLTASRNSGTKKPVGAPRCFRSGAGTRRRASSTTTTTCRSGSSPAPAPPASGRCGPVRPRRSRLPGALHSYPDCWAITGWPPRRRPNRPPIRTCWTTRPCNGCTRPAGHRCR